MGGPCSDECKALLDGAIAEGESCVSDLVGEAEKGGVTQTQVCLALTGSCGEKTSKLEAVGLSCGDVDEVLAVEGAVEDGLSSLSSLLGKQEQEQATRGEQDAPSSTLYSAMAAAIGFALVGVLGIYCRKGKLLQGPNKTPAPASCSVPAAAAEAVASL